MTDTTSNNGNDIPSINPLKQISARTSIEPIPIGSLASASQSEQNSPRGLHTMQLADTGEHFGSVGSSDNGDNEMTRNMTSRSRDIIKKMDKDGDGMISYEEAISFGKNAKKEEKKWKHLFAASICFIFIIFAIIFGLFILGFELTKITDLGGNHGTSLITTNGEQVTTVTGEEEVDIDKFWDDDIEYDDMVIRWVRGEFGGQYMYITVSYFIKYDSPNYLEIFDNSGNIRIDYYLNEDESPNGNQITLYQTLSNGTIIERGLNSRRRRMIAQGFGCLL